MEVVGGYGRNMQSDAPAVRNCSCTPPDEVWRVEPYSLDSDSVDASTRATSCRIQNIRDDDEKVELDGPVSNQSLDRNLTRICKGIISCRSGARRPNYQNRERYIELTGPRQERMYEVRFLHIVRPSCAAAIGQFRQVDHDLHA